MDYQKRYQKYLDEFMAELQPCCDRFLPEESKVCQAARYSLLAGGKRVRAVLCMAVCDMLGGDIKTAAHFACAVEMLHCYSLIHDDLPCMDNDDFRRGRPSCHKAFDEATALLAGDVLLTEAFEVISSAEASAEIRSRAVKALSSGAGSRGMVWGQELDLCYENQTIGLEELQQIHRNKTGALINAAVQMGVAAANGTAQDEDQLYQYAFDLGVVFQIVDDILDVLSTSEELGKPIGSDQENGKTTYYTLYGAEGAMKLAGEINERLCERLKQTYGEKSDFLVALAENLLTRRN